MRGKVTIAALSAEAPAFNPPLHRGSRRSREKRVGEGSPGPAMAPLAQASPPRRTYGGKGEVGREGNLHSSPLWARKGNGERTKASRLLALTAWRWVEGALSNWVLPERLRHCVHSFPTGSAGGKAAQRQRWANKWRWGRAGCLSGCWSLGGSPRLPTGSECLRPWPALLFSCKDRFGGGKDQGGCGGKPGPMDDSLGGSQGSWWQSFCPDNQR